MDVELVDPPSDSISSMSFSSQADYLAVASWDNNVRIYEVGLNGQSRGKALYAHQAPVLSDGAKIFSGGTDSAGRMFDVNTGQSQQVAQHDAPIKCVRWVDTPQGGILATGSWDKTLKYWDLRTPNPVASVQLQDRCYSMDVAYPLLVVGTAERHIQIFNLANPTTPYKTMPSPLSWQTRVVTCSPAADAFAIGSIEGRVAVHYLEEKDSTYVLTFLGVPVQLSQLVFRKSFSFRCHRRDLSPTQKSQSLVFAINDISYHPIHGTLSTCGSDGVMNIWDLDARTRLKVFEQAPGPITSTCFNRTGTVFAYAVSYEWSKGHTGMTPGHPNKVMFHVCTDDEVKKKPPKPR
ncbi:uncharacterized protein FIBRA_02100 [Fibroporia radiculosa]|uniref:Anaphase-promoting complex subunit 4 WD40 domain-containing protein n=1 Tax=Fibroporia radiculosa TaxID=599839 RepID=J4G1C7_9APHY|nr:uncharacterized protein FIBRA_02100 [Fibroporia radiculosa]CCM00073.1 predicted protein [Fibroporia radiculosa]